MKPAVTVRIRVNDTAKLLSAPVAGRYMVMGVFAPGGRFHPFRKTGSDSAGSDHELAVALDTPLQLMVRPVGLAVVDSGNVAVPAAGLSRPLLQSSASPAATALTFSVVGSR